jgi:hypothetical protein
MGISQNRIISRMCMSVHVCTYVHTCMYTNIYMHTYTHTHIPHHYHQNVYVPMDSCLCGWIRNQKTIHSIVACKSNAIYIIIRATNSTS